MKDNKTITNMEDVIKDVEEMFSLSAYKFVYEGQQIQIDKYLDNTFTLYVNDIADSIRPITLIDLIERLKLMEIIGG